MNLPISIHQQDKTNFFFFHGYACTVCRKYWKQPKCITLCDGEKQLYFFKTNVLSSYLILSFCSLIANHIMIHRDFFTSFYFSFLMNFVNFSCICLYNIMVIMRSILMPSSLPDFSLINSACVLCDLGALQTSCCSAPVLQSMPW